MTDQQQPTPTRKGQDKNTARELAGPLGTVIGGIADGIALGPLVAEDLLHHLHMKLHLCYAAQRRSRHFLGRLRNMLGGDDPDNIEMSGTHLVKVFEILGTDGGDTLEPLQTYQLRYDAARRAHDILGAQLKVPPDKLRKGLDEG